ncbi:MAG: SRPBCC family protein [bacterium]
MKMIKMSLLKRAPLFVALLLLAASLAGASDYEPSFEVTEKRWKKLKAGEVLVTERVIEGEGNRKKLRFIATAHISAPPESVWKTIRDYDHYHEFIPRLKESELLKTEGRCMFIRYLGEVFWVEVEYYIKACAEVPGKRVDFGLAEGYESFMKSADGFWEVQKAPDGKTAIVSYSAHLDPGVPVPDFISRKVARDSLVNVLQNVTKRVESGGKWKKED